MTSLFIVQKMINVVVSVVGEVAYCMHERVLKINYITN